MSNIGSKRSEITFFLSSRSLVRAASLSIDARMRKRFSVELPQYPTTCTGERHVLVPDLEGPVSGYGAGWEQGSIEAQMNLVSQFEHQGEGSVRSLDNTASTHISVHQRQRSRAEQTMFRLLQVKGWFLKGVGERADHPGNRIAGPGM